MGLYRANVEGRLLLANPALVSMLGYGALEDLLAASPSPGPHDPDISTKEFWARVERGGGARAIETRWRRQDGTTLTARETIRPVTGKGGIAAYEGTVEDVTEARRKDEEIRSASERLAELVKLQTELLNSIVEENTKRKKVEDDLRAANERLAELARMKTQLLNSVSHELSTPLTPIMLQLYLLRTGRMGSLSDEQKHAVDILDRNLARLSILVKDVLDVSRIEAGRLKIQRQEIDLVDVVAEAVDSFKAPAKANGVSLQQGHPETLALVADKRRIGQVLYNLLSNALKFTPSGGTIKVEAAAGASEVVVSVTDTGLGIRPEDIGKLFQPFSQVHDTMQKTHAGTGLGLYICKGIVEQHGGRIWCESEGISKGTMFAFSLPLGAPTDFEFVD